MHGRAILSSTITGGGGGEENFTDEIKRKRYSLIIQRRIFPLCGLDEERERWPQKDLAFGGQRDLPLFSCPPLFPNLLSPHCASVEISPLSNFFSRRDSICLTPTSATCPRLSPSLLRCPLLATLTNAKLPLADMMPFRSLSIDYVRLPRTEE